MLEIGVPFIQHLLAIDRITGSAILPLTTHHSGIQLLRFSLFSVLRSKFLACCFGWMLFLSFAYCLGSHPVARDRPVFSTSTVTFVSFILMLFSKFYSRFIIWQRLIQCFQFKQLRFLQAEPSSSCIPLDRAYEYTLQAHSKVNFYQFFYSLMSEICVLGSHIDIGLCWKSTKLLKGLSALYI